MRKRRYLGTLISFLILVALSLLFVAFLLREPKYEGKTARQWILLLDPHVDFRSQHDQAADVIARIGANAIPTIRQILQEPKLTPLQKLKNLAERLNLLPPDTVNLADRQYRASRAAYQIAERADADISSLVPLLSYHLTNSNYGDVENGRALANAGPSGITILTNLASHPDPRFRDRAIFSLQYARSKPGVFETYLRTVNDSDQNIRFLALSSLSRYPNADPNLLVPLALERVRSTNQYDRWAATEILATFRADPRAASALTNAAADPDPTVRSVATRALKQFTK